MPIKPIDLNLFEKGAENVYEALVIASKRARQINEEMKIMMNQEIEIVSSKNVEDEEIESNPDMANISLKYEKMEKPTRQALAEMFDHKISFRYKDVPPAV